MHTADWTVLIAYLGGTVLMGILLGKLVKNSADLFSAGGESPWWASGLSAFMTMFSANTFVVWGSIAFGLGLVAVMINLMYGVAALLAGYFIASKWKGMGIATPAEYVRLRFGKGALHFYTWSMMVLRVIGTAAALYALAKILVALMPLGEGNPLRDPETGNLSLRYAILIFGSIVVLYTMIGGLWAVLMTDVLQFIILNLAVLFVVPLALGRVGGVSGFIADAPEGFFNLVNEAEGYTVFFLVGWAAIHFFMIGAEWAFVQRYLCVPTKKDARKSTYLFGILYLVSPILWLLPPMIYQVIDPGADPEQAYILSCKAVLPIGMVGLMLAAMFSATASMVSSQLNVFSGVLTNDIYKPLAKKTDSSSMVKAGRFFTIFLGALLIFIALEIEKFGQVKDLIISITSLMVVPLLAPSIWGLFSRRINGRAVWITGLSGFAIGAIIRFGFGENGWFESMTTANDWVVANASFLKTFVGVIFPVMVLGAIEIMSRGESEGWKAIAALTKQEDEAEHQRSTGSNPIAAKVVAWCLAVCSLMMFSLIAVNDSNSTVVLSIFGAILAVISGVILFVCRKSAATQLSQ
ncbi:Na+:solute symporter [Verrucomicrobiaceae bacterium 5K15]|uniref:Na+:solute symporter n=1 Tax=Oceaniferula flava TaxID=2800421 RepID=A0AAE2VA33_9BACT|nr:sodium:solute symporter family protein [Oceaniferula flavus]MBK1856228.1 Na+:solute symporter [Oceaniferula flavus]MBM1137535.1 Na+:solute symporter [Oceaniferula flavus]